MKTSFKERRTAEKKGSRTMLVSWQGGPAGEAGRHTEGTSSGFRERSDPCVKLAQSLQRKK